MSKALEQQGVGDGSIHPLENQENAIAYPLIEYHVKHLTGRLLTIADASFSDVQQRKAVKDLMRSELQSQLRQFGRVCNVQQSGANLDDVG